MQWVASTLHSTSEHGVSSIITADAAHIGCQQSTEMTPPADLNGLVRFARKTKSWFLRVCHHMLNAVYQMFCSTTV